MNGHDSDSIEENILKINASVFTPIDGGAIPTGEFQDVEGTPFDFRMGKTIDLDIERDC